LFLEEEVPDWCFSMKKSPYDQTMFGLAWNSATDDDAKRLKLARAEGAVISRVIKGLPAELAGLKVDDVIMEIDGTSFKGKKTIDEALVALTSNRAVHFSVIRRGENYEIVVQPPK
jgi:S1-C subfamily serine protease